MMCNGLHTPVHKDLHSDSKQNLVEENLACSPFPPFQLLLCEGEGVLGGPSLSSYAGCWRACSRKPLTLDYLEQVLLKLMRAKARQNTPPQTHPQLPPPPLSLAPKHLEQLFLRLMKPTTDSDAESDDSENSRSKTDEASKFEFMVINEVYVTNELPFILGWQSKLGGIGEYRSIRLRSLQYRERAR